MHVPVFGCKSPVSPTLHMSSTRSWYMDWTSELPHLLKFTFMPHQSPPSGPYSLQPFQNLHYKNSSWSKSQPLNCIFKFLDASINITTGRNCFKWKLNLAVSRIIRSLPPLFKCSWNQVNHNTMRGTFKIPYIFNDCSPVPPSHYHHTPKPPPLGH